MKCSICGSNNVKFWCSKKGHSIFCCKACQFVFAPVIFSQTIEYYGQDYLHNKEGLGGYVNYELDKIPMRKTFENILKIIKNVNKEVKLLDAGTANGFFLDIAKDYGFYAEGFDINKSAVDDAISRGRNVKYVDIFRNLYKPNSFNIITAFDFFEHIPHNMINELASIFYNLLAPGGVLVIITINTASPWARLFGKRWHTLLPPEHVSFFNKKNISSFLKKSGFKIIEINTIHKTFSLQYLFNILTLWQGFVIWKKITHFLERHPRLGTISIRPYIGDNMLIIAQKK